MSLPLINAYAAVFVVENISFAVTQIELFAATPVTVNLKLFPEIDHAAATVYAAVFVKTIAGAVPVDAVVAPFQNAAACDSANPEAVPAVFMTEILTFTTVTFGVTIGIGKSIVAVPAPVVVTPF